MFHCAHALTQIQHETSVMMFHLTLRFLTFPPAALTADDPASLLPLSPLRLASRMHDCPAVTAYIGHLSNMPSRAMQLNYSTEKVAKSFIIF